MVILDSGRINATTVANQSFANLYNLINNRSNVSDPLNPDDTGTTFSRKFVHVRMPRVGRNFSTNAGFPFIIVRNTRPVKGNTTADLSKVFRFYNHIIEVFANDESADGLGNPEGAETRNDIVDSIINTLDKPLNRKTLIDQGMAGLIYDIDLDDDFDVEGNTVFKAEFDIRFENNLTLT